MGSVAIASVAKSVSRCDRWQVLNDRSDQVRLPLVWMRGSVGLTARWRVSVGAEWS